MLGIWTVGLIIKTKRDDEWRRTIMLCNGSSINSCSLGVSIRRVRRYQRSIQDLYIGGGQTTQWLKKYEQRSTKHSHKAKDRVTPTSQKKQETRTKYK